MKRTNNLINAAIAVVFVGVLLYLGVYLLRSFNNGYVTAEAEIGRASCRERV